MTQNKKINKQATIQKILDWAGKGIGKNINIDKFNKAMEKSDWEKTLKEMAEFCEVEVVYC